MVQYLLWEHVQIFITKTTAKPRHTRDFSSHPGVTSGVTRAPTSQRAATAAVFRPLWWVKGLFLVILGDPLLFVYLLFFFTCFLSSDVIHLFFNISQHQILLLVKHTPKEIQQTRFTRCSMIAVPSSTELPAAMDSAFRSANHWPPNPVAFSGVGSTPFEVPKWPLMEVVPKSRLVFPPEKN